MTCAFSSLFVFMPIPGSLSVSDKVLHQHLLDSVPGWFFIHTKSNVFFCLYFLYIYILNMIKPIFLVSKYNKEHVMQLKDLE